MSIPLARIEEIIDACGVAPPIEALLPIGVRHRQLRVRTLLAGMMLTQAGHRPAHLTRVRGALTALPADDQARLGVIEDWTVGPHLLTYRQTERTFGLVADALAKDAPDGLPSPALQQICDDLLEASIPDEHKHASTALAVDWTDVETFSRPPPHGTRDCADPEAWWGHRSGGGPGQDSELFFGYYLSAGTTMREEHGPPVPELTRRMTVCSCDTDPARALVPVLTAMPEAGIPLGDLLADSGYAHRNAGAWAIPLRQAGAQLVQDLHPSDRGPRGTHHGAIIANGNLYCPAAPTTLLELGPLARDATPDQTAAHDLQTAETARYKLGKTAGLLPAADHHGAARGEREDRAKARLPLKGTPAVLRPPHRRRADLLHRQGPRQQQHRPRLDQAHGPGPDHALARLPAGRPQPANPGRLGRPPGRQRPPRRGRPATQNPPPAPQDPHRPGHRRHPALTRPAPAQPRQAAPSPAPPRPRHPRPAGPARKHSGEHAAARKPPKTATHAERQTQT